MEQLPVPPSLARICCLRLLLRLAAVLRFAVLLLVKVVAGRSRRGCCRGTLELLGLGSGEGGQLSATPSVGAARSPAHVLDAPRIPATAAFSWRDEDAADDATDDEGEEAVSSPHPVSVKAAGLSPAHARALRAVLNSSVRSGSCGQPAASQSAQSAHSPVSWCSPAQPAARPPPQPPQPRPEHSGVPREAMTTAVLARRSAVSERAAVAAKLSAAGGPVVVRSPRRWDLVPLRILPEDLETMKQLRIGLPVILSRISE